MHRFGLVDFWYYTNEEFHFKKGHMLLRGSNGSGKSVTMQSFIPLLLDGNKSSERLDPFGTRSRKIENYLIDENDGRTDRIGYLYLEFKREESDVYKTIGMGLHAKKGKPVDSWYFVIEDNRRINRDISLMDGKLALTRLQLKHLLGEQVIEGQREYMERVNQALFGFESIDVYKEAISLLLQLRSPKLSNSLKPTMINEVLSDSLQPLSEDDLRPMSEAISNMDSHKDRIDTLKQSLVSAQNIMKVYDQYNHFILFDKLKKYERESTLFEELTSSISKNEQHLTMIQQDYERYEKQQNTLLQEQRILTEEQLSLGNKDAQLLYEEAGRLKEEAEKLKIQIEGKEKTEETKSNAYMDIKQAVKVMEDDADSLKEEMMQLFADAQEYQDVLGFSEHDILQQELMHHMDQEYDVTYIRSIAEQEMKELDAGIQLFQEYEKKKAALEADHEQKEAILNELEMLTSKAKKYEEQYIGIVEEYKESFRKINVQNQILKLSEETMQQVFQYLIDYEEQPQYHIIKDLIQEEYQGYYQDHVQREALCKQELDKLHDKINETQTSLSEWKKQEDPLPEMDEQIKANRSYLMQKKIPFRALYSVMEFDDSVTLNQKNKLEEVLMRSGLMNVLLVKETYRNEVLQFQKGTADHYLFIQQDPTKIKPWLFYDNGQNDLASQFQEMLESFGCESKDFSVHEDYYKHGLITGTHSGDYCSIYIGEESRKQHRKAMIRKLEQELQELSLKMQKAEEAYHELIGNMHRLEEERLEFPDEGDLHLADQELKQCHQQMDAVYRQMQRIEERLKLHEERLTSLRLQIQEVADKLSITAEYNVFVKRKSVFQQYLVFLQDVKVAHIRYLNKIELLTSKKIQQEDILEDLDTLRFELKTMEERFHGLRMQIEAKQKQLEELGFDQIQKRLEEITQRLLVIPSDLKDCNQMVGTLQEKIHQLKEKLEHEKDMLSTQQTKVDMYYNIVKEEVGLHYVLSKGFIEENWLQKIKEIQHTYVFKRSPDTLNEDLQQSIFTNRDQLQEHNLTLLHILPYEDVEDVAKRLDIETRYQGNRISLQELLIHLEDDIRLEESLLLESDKNLFEEILVNVISKQIRRHIQESIDWVSRMNRYMDEMNTSSGLKLSLKWEKKKAESTEELHTKELIDLLQTDPAILSLTGKQKLSAHFRAKIETARKHQEEEGNLFSFHQLMRDAMDYRKWFEFKILTQKTGENKKELTNNLFFSYSGGEKAMSMYVPLFSAVAAKFESARDEAPLLIALDEAFAGVDEKNINNMFGLIEKFKFDYIMNSQVLWGDYANVRSLAIYELFRPENARFVTVIAYEWDGKVKRMKA